MADVAALDVYEPAWQQRWLGDSVPLAEGLRARYGGIVMDVAWALFEVRMLREPGADPNAVWTDAHRRLPPHPAASRSCPGGPCAASWWMRRAT